VREKFVEIDFRVDTLTMLTTIDEIQGEYRTLGFALTVRQLYYQLVARGHIPNNDRPYKRIVGIVGDGRLAGFLDWEWPSCCT
jgi:hypothetical protein